MSRILRLAFVGIVLTLTSLVFDVASVGAKWVHLGDFENHVGTIQACDNIVTLGAAVVSNIRLSDGTWTGQDNRSANPSFKWIDGSYYKSYSRIDLQTFDLFRDASPNTYRWLTTEHSQTIRMDDGRTTRKWSFIDLTIDDVLMNADKYLLIAIVDYSPAHWLVVDVIPASQILSSCNPDIRNFKDGRVDAYEPWESVAAYCEDKMVKVYGIDASGNGYFAFAITQEDIDKLGIPTENTLLASFPSAFGGKIRLYKLKNTGELQINAPGLPPESWKEYVFTWVGCS